MRILVVEDDERLGQLIQRALRNEGHATDLVGQGDEALVLAGATAYDAIVLDVMLPGLDGFEVCRRMRADEIWTSVLLLTAREDVESRVAGLDAGADDYLVKPFALDELLARLRALTRRGPGRRPVVLEAGGLRLDVARHVVMRGDTAIELSPKELALLEALMRRVGDVVSRFDLLEAAWDDSYEHRSNVIDVHLRNLREKIDRASDRHERRGAPDPRARPRRRRWRPARPIGLHVRSAGNAAQLPHPDATAGVPAKHIHHESFDWR